LSEGHFWGLLGTAILITLIGMCGVFLCGIGALFTTPLAVLTMAAGYLLITGSPMLSRPVPQSQPPTYDGAYQARQPYPR
jgi:hypothetical protein